MHNHLLNVNASWAAAIWKQLNPVLHFLHDCLLDRATTAYSAVGGSKSTIARLLDLLVGHARPWQQWCRQRLARTWHVYRGHDEQRAHTIPHVALLVEFGV